MATRNPGVWHQIQVRGLKGLEGSNEQRRGNCIHLGHSSYHCSIALDGSITFLNPNIKKHYQVTLNPSPQHCRCGLQEHKHPRAIAYWAKSCESAIKFGSHVASFFTGHHKWFPWCNYKQNFHPSTVSHKLNSLAKERSSHTYNSVSTFFLLVVIVIIVSLLSRSEGLAGSKKLDTKPIFRSWGQRILIFGTSIPSFGSRGKAVTRVLDPIFEFNKPIYSTSFPKSLPHLRRICNGK